MAKKKYYAVRQGRQTGIFHTWEECKKAVHGYGNAVYKSFERLEDAGAYLKGTSAASLPPQTGTEKKAVPGELIAYVDGSYEDKIKRYSFGCVIITPEGDIIEESGSGNQKDSLAIRNVAGEMIGAMYAAKWAMVNGYKKIEIRYDYAGIEHWVTGAWKAKNELTRKYAQAMNSWQDKVSISFRKVTAHSGNHYNDEADRLAKEALTGKEGIPVITPRTLPPSESPHL